MGPLEAYRELRHRPEAFYSGMAGRLWLRDAQSAVCSPLSRIPGPVGLWALRRLVAMREADARDLAELQALAALLDWERG
jgi:hypothetical protein